MTSGGGPLLSVGIFRPKFAVPFLQTRSLPYLGNSEKKQKVARAIPILGFHKSCDQN